MEAILKYDLNDIDDKKAHLRAVLSDEMALFIWEFSQELRSLTKYAPDSMPDEEYNTYKRIREMFHQQLNSRNIDVETLI